MDTLQDHTIIRLEREVAELRAELRQLRADLAGEIRTKSIVVDDGERQVEITPGRLVAYGGNGCHVALGASDWFAELNVVVGDITFAGDTAETDRARRRERQRSVMLTATYLSDTEHGGPEATIDVNDVELDLSAIS